MYYETTLSKSYKTNEQEEGNRREEIFQFLSTNTTAKPRV